MTTTKFKIMLVDDHAETREHMASLIDLQPDIMVTAQAGSGEDCLMMCEQAQPDLIVMDILLPMLNGIETTRRVLTRYPGQLVLIMSNYDGKTLFESVKDAGARGYVKKDEAFENLLPAIREVLAGKTAFGEAE